MTYWTVLLITLYGGHFHGESTYLVYPSWEACFAAHQTVSDTLGYDHQIECIETDVPSGVTVRPQARPW